ncbi:MAG: tetratricopeptide repeat protein, partial [Rhizobiaceae bacterium]|nr:tetratricopeptide repeat protein [Rhizobiaceae bacterium]
EWLTLERQRLHNAAVRILERLAEVETGDARIAAAQRLVQLDPLREASHRALMRAHAALGDKGSALKQFETCQNLLRAELGVEPSRETAELRDQISATVRDLSDRTFPGHQEASIHDASCRIAVLPFLNLSGDPDQEYFADGLTEDIITDISNLPGCFVIARNSAFVYKGKPTDIRQIARDLEVRYILEGSARRAGQRLRVNVQLIDAVGGGAHIFAERFDREIIEIFAVQDEITRRVVETVTGRLTSSPIVERRRPTNMEAYDLCVSARSLMHQSKSGNIESRALLETAIALEPDYCEAHWRLAENLGAGYLVWSEPPEPIRRRALMHASRAVCLDPKDANAHAILGTTLHYEGRWDEAEDCFDTAIRLNPNNAEILAKLSDFKYLSGEPHEAIECALKALRLDPHPPGFIYWFLGSAQVAAGKYEDAVLTLKREETYRTTSRRDLCVALVKLGRISEARDEARLFLLSNPDWRISTTFEVEAVYKNPDDKQFWIDGFRAAGLPD